MGPTIGAGARIQPRVRSLYKQNLMSEMLLQTYFWISDAKLVLVNEKEAIPRGLPRSYIVPQARIDSFLLFLLQPR